MLKEDLVNNLAVSHGLSKAKCQRIFESIQKAIQDELNRNGIAVLPGIVRIRKTWRPEYQGVNPATGEPMVIPGKLVFRAKALRTRQYL